MKTPPRRVNITDRIKPLEGVGTVFLFLGTLMVLCWATFALVRLVMG